MPLTSTYATISSTQTDADSPLDTLLMDQSRQNQDVLRESMIGKGTFTFSTAHNHDGINSAPIDGASLTFIASATANNSASIDFEGATHIDGSYHSYLFTLERLRPNTNAVILYMRMSDDGGSTYQTGSYSFVRREHGQGGVTNSVSSANAGISMTGGVGTAANEAVSGDVRLFEADSTVSYAKARFDLMQNINADSVRGSGNWHGNSTSTINAIRFLFDTGNIISGTIRLYGVKNS
ncbi:MAG: hypothetical protein MJA29_04360 [Candidatus Omnitrophica bacterium]|nr:hypothetical protein [Candidatus Omnitrophota bacterium]